MRIVKPSQDGIGDKMRQVFQTCQSGKDDLDVTVTVVNDHLVAYRKEPDGSVSEESVEAWAQ